VSSSVAGDSTKDEIAAAVEALFKVNVTKVNTLNVKGKTKRFRGIMGRRSDVKKAIVTWPKASRSTSLRGSEPMALKHFNPTSPGRRQLVLVDKSELHKGGPRSRSSRV
jgi:ribosomal protein L23